LGGSVALLARDRAAPRAPEADERLAAEVSDEEGHLAGAARPGEVIAEHVSDGEPRGRSPRPQGVSPDRAVSRG